MKLFICTGTALEDFVSQCVKCLKELRNAFSLKWKYAISSIYIILIFATNLLLDV